MREIKFKAYWKEAGMVVDIESLHSNGGITFFVDAKIGNKVEKTLQFLDEKTQYELMQFTGLYDKNEKEAYRGDIVLLPDSEIIPITDEGQGPEEEMNHLCPIEYENGCFGLRVLEDSGTFRKGFWSFDSIFKEAGYKLSDLEIIGNVYQNSNLINDYGQQ